MALGQLDPWACQTSLWRHFSLGGSPHIHFLQTVLLDHLPPTGNEVEQMFNLLLSWSAELYQNVIITII